MKKLTYEIEFAFKLEFFEVFLKKMFRFPLLLDGGVRGFIFLGGGLNSQYTIPFISDKIR